MFLLMMSAFIISSAALAQQQEPGKCSACQLAKSIREAIAQSIKDAQMAALAAGGSFSRERELDMDSEQAKCGCKTRSDELATDVDREAAKCGCKTRNDALATDLDADPATTVAACCEFCAQPGSLGCQGVNSAQCNTCQQGLIKLARAIDVSRAPREELIDPCDPCGGSETDCIDSCVLNEQLRALRCCCASVAQTLGCQGKAARKCCKKLKEKIEDVEELIEDAIDEAADCCSLTETLLISIIDQSAECCSIIDTNLGDPTTSALDIPFCQIGSIVDVVNGIDADVLTWLKSLYVLLYNVHLCTCCLT